MPSNPNTFTIFAATNNGIYRTTDALNSNPQWNNLYDVTNPSDPIKYTMGPIRGLAFDPNNANHIFASGKDIIESFDNGITWSTITGSSTGYAFDWNDEISGEAVQLINICTAGNNLYAYIIVQHVGSQPKYYIKHYDISTNTWSSSSYFQVGGGGTEDVSIGRMGAFIASSTNPNKVYWGYTKLARSSDFGMTREPTMYPDYNKIIHADLHKFAFRGNNLYVAHDGGISKILNADACTSLTTSNTFNKNGK